MTEIVLSGKKQYNLPMDIKTEDVLFEDADFLILNKTEYRPVQPDKSGDLSLLEELGRDSKWKIAGNLGPAQRLDRPVRGVILFARTGRGLAAFNRLLQEKRVNKQYLAFLEKRPERNEGILKNHLVRQNAKNRSIVVDGPGKRSREAILSYRIPGQTERYTMAEIILLTGRHHQIRVQFSHIGCPVKGDVKYGAKRSNREGGISLFSRKLEFEHPFTGGYLSIAAPLPSEVLWNCFTDHLKGENR